MGNTYTVLAWVPDTRFGPADGYHYEMVISTESVFRALWCLWTNRRAGGCVKLEVRLSHD